MKRPSKNDAVTIFLLAFLAFGIVFTLVFMVELVWPK